MYLLQAIYVAAAPIIEIQTNNAQVQFDLIVRYIRICRRIRLEQLIRNYSYMSRDDNN